MSEVAWRLTTRDYERLRGVHPDLRRVVELAATRCVVPFRVIEGVRTLERQQQLYAQGRTAPGEIVTWTMKSKHFRSKVTGFGHAVDLLPAPYDWKATEPFDVVASAVLTAADELSIPVRWGADWDADGKPRERGESDSPHFELAL